MQSKDSQKAEQDTLGKQKHQDILCGPNLRNLHGARKTSEQEKEALQLLAERVAQEPGPRHVLKLRHATRTAARTTSTVAVTTAATCQHIQLLEQLVDLGSLEIDTHLEVWVEGLEVDLGQVALVQD